MIEILDNRSILHVAGLDAGKFLQGMTTNDIINNIYSYNYLLTNQGKYLFDFFVYKESSNSYFIDINSTNLQALIKHFSLYKLRSNVEFKDISSDYCIIYSTIDISKHAEFSIQDPRYKVLGYRSMVKKTNINLLDDNLSIVYNLYSADKYKYTIVDGVEDLLYSRSVPLEYGAEELNAIDYNKGCYVGQEVISRVKYQGVVRKKIFKLEFDVDINIELQGKEVVALNGDRLGVVCSNYKKEAICLLREEKFLGLDQKLAMVVDRVSNIKIPLWR